MFAAYGGNTERSIAFREAMSAQKRRIYEAQMEARRLAEVKAEKAREAKKLHFDIRMLYREVSTPNRPRAEVSPNNGMLSVVREMARQTGYDEKDIRGLSRLRSLTRIRFRAMLEIRRRFPEASTREIGEIFGGRDHTTVMHALKRAEEMFGQGA